MNHGIEFEAQIHEICEKYFLPDLVFKNPSYSKNSKTNRELADLVMPLGKTLLAFQVRSILSEAVSDVHTQRFARRVDHALSQFKVLRELVQKSGTIIARSARGISIPLSFETGTEVLGILVINQSLDRLKDIRPHQFRGFSESVGFPVHIFSRRDFMLLARTLDTLPDLLAYLRVRAKILGQGRIVGSKGESSLLWLHLKRPDLVERACMAEKPVLFAAPPAPFPKKINLSDRVAGERRRLGGVMTDHVIAVLHDLIAGAAGDMRPLWAQQMAPPSDEKMYWMLMQEFAALDRSSREQIGEKLIEKMMRADAHGYGFAIVAPNCRPVLRAAEEKSLLFDQRAVLVHSTRESRKERIEQLDIMANIAIKAYGLRQVIGITTDSWKIEPRFFDFVLKRVTECEILPEARELAKKYFGPGSLSGNIPVGESLQSLQRKFPRLKIETSY